jgi:hypothetical protein
LISLLIGNISAAAKWWDAKGTCVEALKIMLSCEIWGFYGEYEDGHCLLGCGTA